MKGIFVNNVEHKLSQYANKIRNFFLHATEHHLKPVLQLLIILEEDQVYV